MAPDPMPPYPAPRWRSLASVRTVLKILAFALAVTMLLVVAGVGAMWWEGRKTQQRQAELADFYTPPDPLPPGEPGDLIRIEPLTGDFTVPGADAYRMLYRTQWPDGRERVSGGMVFIPQAEAPAEGRKIISWAHPTAGMGDACAASRAQKPTNLLSWLPAMINNGWVVTATDYAGLGTPGTELYLIAEAEVADVVNAVRAARQVEGAQAGTDYGVFGHSQGGHASLWAATLAPEYAPELNLVGVSGAAPAGPLADLVSALWDSTTAWVIGAEVLVSYPEVYPELSLEAVATDAALGSYESLAQRCLISGSVEGELRSLFGEQFFRQDPMNDPAWAAAIEDQSAPPPDPSMPVQVIESVNDGVVVPRPIAKMAQEWCDAGVNLTVDWLGPLRGSEFTEDIVSHMYEGSIGGALATTWFEELFEGRPVQSNCGITAPLALDSDQP